MSRTALIRALAVPVLLGLLAAAVVWAQGSSGRTFLRRAHISEPSTGYVQLYFRGPRSLPDYVVRAHARQRVSFVLVNDEQGPRTLHWRISTQSHPAAARGTSHLAAGGVRAIRRTVAVRCTRRRVYVAVHLDSPKESIGYWIACPSSTAKEH